MTVAEALLSYARPVQGYYPPGTARGHFDALRPVRQLAGALPLREFTPKVFKAVRQSMVDAELSRTTFNWRAGKVKQWLRWCVAEELVPPAVLDAVRAVPGLRKGRGEAKELPPVRPPSAGDLDRVLARTSAVAAALARVQMVCGARAGELVRLRGEDLDRSGPVWKAGVAEHKGEWRGKGRTLYFGPLAQAVLAPLVLKASGGFLFATGKGRPYGVAGYRQELQRGCARAGVEEFGTHVLRHFAATRIRALVDVETARALFGHSDLRLTAEVYAERGERKLVEAMARVG